MRVASSALLSRFSEGSERIGDSGRGLHFDTSRRTLKLGFVNRPPQVANAASGQESSLLLNTAHWALVDAGFLAAAGTKSEDWPLGLAIEGFGKTRGPE